MALSIETQTILRLGGASWTLEADHTVSTPHGTFVLLSPHRAQFCRLLAAQHNVKLPKKPSLSRSDFYETLLDARNKAERKHQQNKATERVQEESSGLFGNADTERAMVEVGSPPKKKPLRRTLSDAREARRDQHVLSVTWREQTFRALGAGHSRDVPRVLLEDLPGFFEASSSAALAVEDFNSGDRQTFFKGTPASDKVVGIGGGRKARRLSGLRRFAVVKHGRAEASPEPVQDAAPSTPAPAPKRQRTARARHGRNVD